LLRLRLAMTGKGPSVIARSEARINLDVLAARIQESKGSP
jgi:hypothetical protein